MATWACGECGEEENGAADALCLSCDAPRPAAAAEAAHDSDDKYKGFLVAVVRALEDLPGKKLRVAVLDVGGGATLSVVTNAPNVNVGSHCCVATPGAVVGELVIKKTSVAGVVSEARLQARQLL